MEKGKILKVKNFSRLFPYVEWSSCVTERMLRDAAEVLYLWHENNLSLTCFTSPMTYPCSVSDGSVFVCRVPSTFPLALGLHALRVDRSAGKDGRCSVRDNHVSLCDVEYRLIPHLDCIEYTHEFVSSFPVLCTRSQVEEAFCRSVHCGTRYIPVLESVGISAVECSNYPLSGIHVLEYLRRKEMVPVMLRTPEYMLPSRVVSAHRMKYDSFVNFLVGNHWVKPEDVYRNSKGEGVYCRFVDDQKRTLWMCSMTPEYGKSKSHTKYDRVNVRLYKTSLSTVSSYLVVRDIFALTLHQYIAFLRSDTSGFFNKDFSTVLLRISLRSDARIIPDSVLVALGFRYELGSYIRSSQYWTEPSGVLGCYAGDAHPDGIIRCNGNKGCREWMASTLADIHASRLQNTASGCMEKTVMTMAGYHRIKRMDTHVWSSEILMQDAERVFQNMDITNFWDRSE